MAQARCAVAPDLSPGTPCLACFLEAAMRSHERALSESLCSGPLRGAREGQVCGPPSGPAGPWCCPLPPAAADRFPRVRPQSLRSSRQHVFLAVSGVLRNRRLRSGSTKTQLPTPCSFLPFPSSSPIPSAEQLPCRTARPKELFVMECSRSSLFSTGTTSHM